MGKLIVPTVFRDMDLFEELLEGYNPITHQVMDIDGSVLLKIGEKEIKEAFNLIPTEEVTHKIDFNTFDSAFG